MSDDIEGLARAHGVSKEAVRVLQDAVRRGGGQQAQFSHPDLGGTGQWSASGMTQIGDMFNAGLKDRVAALCAALTRHPSLTPENHTSLHNHAGPWWPEGLGQPSATGSQNGIRYACFPHACRVAIEQAGVLTLYDSQDHAISGVAQQQSASPELVFTSQKGSVRASDLPVPA